MLRPFLLSCMLLANLAFNSLGFSFLRGHKSSLRVFQTTSNQHSRRTFCTVIMTADAQPNGDRKTAAQPKRNGKDKKKNRTTVAHFQDRDFASNNKNTNNRNSNGGRSPQRKPPVNRPNKPKFSSEDAFLKLKSYPLKPRDSPTVAVIGGGISGLVCAKTLEENGIRATVFDTGKNEVGGRCSTREFERPGQAPLIFDHSAQFATVSEEDIEWTRLVQEMLEAGVMREWGQGCVGRLAAGGAFQPLGEGGNPMQAYIGVQGMRDIPRHLAQGLQVERPVWVSKMKRDPRTGGWGLWHYQEALGTFDYVVVAHNGKCAARLMSTAGREYGRLYQILDTKFGAELRYPKSPRNMQLCSLWAVLVHFDKDVPVPAGMEGAFVEGSDVLSWVANNSAKLQGLPAGGSSWTLISTPQYGQRNKCPQENIPAEHGGRVVEEMLGAFEEALGTAPGSLRPTFSSAQLWGAANPVSVGDTPLEEAFVFQEAARVGVCGDWLRRPSLGAAAESGARLARHLAAAAERRRDQPLGVIPDQEYSAMDVQVGLRFKARPATGAAVAVSPIGDFSSTAGGVADIAAVDLLTT